jgi:hypothetical protein
MQETFESAIRRVDVNPYLYRFGVACLNFFQHRENWQRSIIGRDNNCYRHRVCQWKHPHACIRQRPSS